MSSSGLVLEQDRVLEEEEEVVVVLVDLRSAW